MTTDILFIVFGYLLGSVSSAIITCRIMGLPDPREQGSGNPGATNVLRTGGKSAAAITLFGDLLKGLIPVLLAKHLGVDDPILGAVALAAVIGHMYPIFFGFKGGKGVATALGVLLGIDWLVGAIWAATWLGVAFLSRISSLSALTAMVLTPLYTWLVTESIPLTVTAVILALIVIWRHRSNIMHLIEGTEGRI
ncbi:MAG: glycerol-3-phosphate 1-O-acyltransferase PlsY [Pseudomonadota bacterium]|nr:glycerol-3-phosphate 1-O-acyltransferase PlsY [Pseudomonadota bacterium]